MTEQVERFNQIIKRIAGMLRGEQKVYLVGGAVRDFLLRRDIYDWDFAVEEDARPLARSVANQLGGAYYVLDEERKTARVLVEFDRQKTVMDFATLRASSLLADLQDRDFTINAIALDLQDLNHLIDPLNGQADLKDKCLRHCSSESFKNDPARVLRGLRMALKYGFHLEKATLLHLKEAISLLPQVSIERQRDELFKMFEAGQSRAAVELMDRLGVLAVILPDLQPLKHCEQSAPHVWDVWLHTLNILHQSDILLDILTHAEEERRFSAESLIPALSLGYLGKYRDRINMHFTVAPVPQRSRRALFIFSALLHDIGKSLTRSVEPGGRVRFFDHEKKGAELARRISEAWALSNDEAEYVEKMLALHMRIHLLANNPALPDKRVIHRFFRDAGDLGVDLCILSLADTLATRGTELPVDVWNKELQVCSMLLEAWYEQKDQVVTPEKLLSGNEVMKLLNIPPGMLVGEILETLKEAQAAGEVLTYEAAVNYIKQWYQRHMEGEDYGSISHN